MYELASRVNHACFPNVARFDNFDGVLSSPSHEFHVPSPRRPEPAGPHRAQARRHRQDPRRVRGFDELPPGERVVRAASAAAAKHVRLRVRVRTVRHRVRVGDGGRRGYRGRGGRTETRREGRGRRGTRRRSSRLTRADALDRECERVGGVANRSLDAAELTRRADRIPPTYALWFVRNMCPVDGCGGTLAPPHARADHMTCNYCGGDGGDEEFFAGWTREPVDRTSTTRCARRERSREVAIHLDAKGIVCVRCDS